MCPLSTLLEIDKWLSRAIPAYVPTSNLYTLLIPFLLGQCVLFFRWEIGGLWNVSVKVNFNVSTSLGHRVPSYLVKGYSECLWKCFWMILTFELVVNCFPQWGWATSNPLKKEQGRILSSACFWVVTWVFSSLHNRTWARTHTIGSPGSHAFWLKLELTFSFSGSPACYFGLLCLHNCMSQFHKIYLYLGLSTYLSLALFLWRIQTIRAPRSCWNRHSLFTTRKVEHFSSQIY